MRSSASSPSGAAPPNRLVVALGGGGVGKTTLSAALALGLAKKGLRTVVLTVDPAKRLASVLGLETLTGEPRMVESHAGGGSAHALWLDSRSAFESLVRRYAPQTADRVLKNRLFGILQSQLGGVEEYLGVEKILSVGRSGDFDVCVLDTPPSRHALDFLDSARHLLAFFDESVLRFFVEPDKAPSRRLFSRLLDTGRGQALELFRSFLGKSFLGELSGLLTEFRPVYEVLQARAREIDAWTSSELANYLLVAALEPYPLEEAAFLSRELETRGLRGRRVLALNKCLPPSAPPSWDVIEKAVGLEATKLLRARHATEKSLRARVPELFGDLHVVELPRAAGRSLDLDRLLELGLELVEEGKFL